MSEPREHDPLIDACLEEVLGGARAPDVSARVLARLAAISHGVPREDDDVAPLSVLPATTAPAIADPAPPPLWSGATTAGAADLRGTIVPVQRLRSRGSTWAMVAAWVAVAACVGVVAWRWTLVEPSKPNLANQDAVHHDAGDPDKKGTSVAPTLPTPVEGPALAVDAHDPIRPEGDPESTDGMVADGNPAGQTTEGFAPEAPGPGETPDPSALATTDPSSSAESPVARSPQDRKSNDRRVVAFVNEKLREMWKTAKVSPSVAATDAEWCRRAYLRLLGRVPRREELDRFVVTRTKTKREDLVDRLMNSQETRDEYARHWASVWANVLIGRSVGLDPAEPASRVGLEAYLTAAIRDDKPYDRLVFEMLTASGRGQPGSEGPDSEGFDGAANFVLANHSDNGALLAAKTSRVFLGVQLQCAQCHNHPTNDLKQHQFWAFDSFFRQIAVERDGQGRHVVTSRDFAGESGNNLDEAEVFYEQRSGVLKAAYPAFLDGVEIPRDGRVAQVDRRRLLAEWIVTNDRLGVAVANRLWSHFHGYGFTRPIDDIGGENQPSNPELLSGLATEFASQGFDLKRLSKWIVLSDSFSRSSKVVKDNVVDAPESGAVPLFARYYTRQMQPEEVFQSLVKVAKIRELDTSGVDATTARVQWMGQFARDMQTDEGDEESSFDGSMKQHLTMMNGDLMRRATRPGDGNLLETVAAAKMPFDHKIEHLFLSAVARKPTPRELDAARKLRGAGAEVDALSDIWWALLNSAEFILDH